MTEHQCTILRIYVSEERVGYQLLLDDVEENVIDKMYMMLDEIKETLRSDSFKSEEVSDDDVKQIRRLLDE